MGKKAQSSVAIVALIVVIVIGVVVGYVALTGGLTDRQISSREETNRTTASSLPETPTVTEPLRNTTIAQEVGNRSQVNATLTSTYYPSSQSFQFICRGLGFTPIAFTWDFGDGSTLILSTNQDVFYHYSKPGTYIATCKAADEKNVARATSRVTVIAASNASSGSNYSTSNMTSTQNKSSRSSSY